MADGEGLMANKYLHLREKALDMRIEQKMTMDEIIERLHVPKTTLWYWIKDHPIPLPNRGAHLKGIGSKAVQRKFAALREEAYQQGLAEAPELLKNPLFRDFVVMYMCEGYKRNRNELSFGNSDPQMVALAYWFLKSLVRNPIAFGLQYHADHDVEELKQFWGDLLGIDPQIIKPFRKSNSNKLAGRQFRSVHGLLTVRVSDTYVRARMQAWMDFVKSQW
jgi:AcrR family transcriptional regulator